MGNITKSYDPWGYMEKARQKVERNRRIVLDYLSGDSMAVVGERFGITAMAVCHVLRGAGISFKDRTRKGRR